MADEVPVTEIRRVVIQYEGLAPAPPMMAPAPEPRIDMDELTEEIRRRLNRIGDRNTDIFGGRA